MESLDQNQFWLLLFVVATAAFFLGRRSAGGATQEERAARRMRDQQEAENAFANMPPTTQQEIDQYLTEGRTIEAIKRFREETGKGLKESKEAIDARRSTMSGV